MSRRRTCGVKASLGRILRKKGILSIVAGVMLLAGPKPSQGQQLIDLTLDRAVELAMGSSYRIRHLELGIEQTRLRLEAERDGLKSQVSLNLNTPDISLLSEQYYDPDLRRNITVRENTRRWQGNLSIRQPVILFGWPTNGYLSLNNRIYRYKQIDEDGNHDITYYNRYFIQFDQPLFQPNRLKNDLERAEISLNDAELNFQVDLAELIDDIASEYFGLFELAYEHDVQMQMIQQLEQAEAMARDIAATDSTKRIDVSQLLVEVANAREQLNQLESQYRLDVSRFKRRLNLTDQDSLLITPNLDIVPIAVDTEEAIEFGKTLLPRLQQLRNDRRTEELDLSNTRGQNSFRANLAVTYGREMENPLLEDLWQEPTNSYSVGLSAYVPIWDWGQRRARVQADQIAVQRADMSIEEAELEIESEIALAVQNLNEYQSRAVAMRDNLTMASDIGQQSLERYRTGAISVLELLQSLRRQADTAQNFLNAYIGYREALLTLQENTFYDFQYDTPLLNRYQVVGTE
jgi:outer membrane protein